MWKFLTKLNISLHYYSLILFLGIYPRKMKAYIPSKKGTRIILAVSFTIVKTRNNNKCPSSHKENGCSRILLGNIKE